MNIMIYKINKKKEWKEKKEIEINEDIFKYCKMGSSMGLELFYASNGKGLRLSTEEFYDAIIRDYNRFKDSNTFSNPTDENGNKLRDKKGKLLRVYSRDEYVNYDKVAYKANYITIDDHNKIWKYFDSLGKHTV